MDHRVKPGGDEFLRVAWHSSGAQTRRENDVTYAPPCGEGRRATRGGAGVVRRCSCH
jgi:hypothetical protein